MKESVADYIKMHPDAKVMVYHGKSCYTFHNCSIWNCLGYWFKTVTKSPRVEKALKEFKWRAQPLRKKLAGECDPHRKPPKGYKIGFELGRGYYYAKETKGDELTNNGHIKNKNITKGDYYEDESNNSNKQDK